MRLNISDIIITNFFIILSFFNDAIPLIVIVYLLVFLDTIYAIRIAIKRKREGIDEIGFQSHRFFNIAPKLFFYGAAIISMFLLDKYIFNDFGILEISFFITKLTTVMFSLNEIKSIDENRIRNNKKSIFVMIEETFSFLTSFKQNLKK